MKKIFGFLLIFCISCSEDPNIKYSSESELDASADSNLSDVNNDSTNDASNDVVAEPEFCSDEGDYICEELGIINNCANYLECNSGVYCPSKNNIGNWFCIPKGSTFPCHTQTKTCILPQ